MKKKLCGPLKGLKKNQIRRLENIYRRRVPPELVITPELSREISLLSYEIHRQIGLLINRLGKIDMLQRSQNAIGKGVFPTRSVINQLFRKHQPGRPCFRGNSTHRIDSNNAIDPELL